LGNVFGKWCRPNYNSVTATFCHNIARDLPIFVSDPNHAIELSYIDDVVAAFIKELSVDQQAESASHGISKYKISLGDLAGRLQAFHEMRETLLMPDFSDWFNRALYATYLSYVPPEVQLYGLNVNSDTRGSLAEFIKGQHFGQVFVSRTKSGITRGNHYHHTKTEKFFVVEGEGLIRMRPIDGRSMVEHFVKGSSYQIVDIPPGFTHSISNVGEGEMVTLFWSSEIFNPNQPDTYYLPVAPEEIKQMVS
jgi:UDP-2-acetamido-2,6-beta-L-arabino-hexul-4-ose reductase